MTGAATFRPTEPLVCNASSKDTASLLQQERVSEAGTAALSGQKNKPSEAPPLRSIPSLVALPAGKVGLGPSWE